MLGNEISDYKQLKAVKTKLDENLSKKLFFKSLYYCGNRVPPKGTGVAVIANKKTARFYGVASCKSPWCCPVCTSRQMAKYAAKIAVGLDALYERGEYAAMLTFTIPHTSGFSCEQSTEILYKTWAAFTIHGNKLTKDYNKNDIFKNFMNTTNSKHRVRVAEYTYGNAGWHPHFHCLFWFPREHFESIVEWEDRLNERWYQLCKEYTFREFLIGYPETQRKTVRLSGIRKLFSCKELPDDPTICEKIFKVKDLVTVEESFRIDIVNLIRRIHVMYLRMDTSKSKGIYISKLSNGKPIRQKSSTYICGWGGNREVCGNVQEKATAEGHYTWQQILQLAIDTNDDKYWDLYFEYATAVRKARHARINFSVHSGLLDIIKEYMRTEKYKTVIKKNRTSQEKTYGKWKVVCWFSKSQWSDICDHDLEIAILEAAINGGIDEINKLLIERRIRPAINPKKYADWLEAKLNAA